MINHLISKLKNEKGFTLVELLIVISIIGILTAVITVSSNASRAQARDVERKANIGLVTAALESYRAENRAYPNAQNWDELENILYPEYIDRWEGNDSEYFYSVSPTGCENIVPGAYYVVEVKLESDRQLTLSDDPSSMNSCEFGFYVSGQYEKDGNIYYRQSGR